MSDVIGHLSPSNARFALGIPEVSVDKSNVQNVRIFAPGWDRAKTAMLAPLVSAMKGCVLAASLCGMQDDEIAEEIAGAFPDLAVTAVRTETGGTRVVVDVA